MLYYWYRYGCRLSQSEENKDGMWCDMESILIDAQVLPKPEPATAADGLTIGMLAKLAVIPIETIRYYERRGLLPKPPRNKSNYRFYPESAVDDIAYIVRAKRLGYTLREIKQLIRFRKSSINQFPEQCLIVDRKIVEILAKIKRLRSNHDLLAHIKKGCEEHDPEECCGLQTLLESKEII